MSKSLKEELDALPLPMPVAYRCWHPRATWCFHLSTEPPSERRTDTGERDEWFGGMVKELVYAEAIRAARHEGARLALKKAGDLAAWIGYDNALDQLEKELE